MDVGSIEIDDVFGTDAPNTDLYFAFESRFEPYRDFVHDELDAIDIVVCDSDKNPIRPLEIKLTTLPDNTTCERPEEDYGSELVIRSATTKYVALSMVNARNTDLNRVRDIFEQHCHNIRDWGNEYEMNRKKELLFSDLETFLKEFSSYQSPLLLQPVWKTVGKSAELANQCLDIFVWSDFALTRLFMDTAMSGRGDKITRPQRTALRLIKFLYEVSANGKAYQVGIYDGMSFNLQTDKEFAISGARTNRYMSCDRLTQPAIHKNEIKKIILGGGQNYLSPERRFDAIIYYSTDLFDEE